MSSITVVSKTIQTFADLLQIEIAYFDPNGVLTVSTEEYKLKKGNRVHLPFFKNNLSIPITL